MRYEKKKIIVVAIGVLWLCFGEKIKILYTSLNSFKDENLAHTFQHTPEIQPTKKINKGENTFEFLKEDNTVLAEGFYFKDIFYPSVGTELENIPVRECLQVASGINFDEDKDMSGFSMRTLMGTPTMKVIKNAIGCGLEEYMEEKLWKKIGAYGQWIYVNPSKQVIIVKTSADPDFMSEGDELKHVGFFRAVADVIS